MQEDPVTYGQTVPLMPFHRACPKLITGSPFPRSFGLLRFFPGIYSLSPSNWVPDVQEFSSLACNLWDKRCAPPLQNIVLRRMPFFSVLPFIYFSRLMEEFQNDLTFILFFFYRLQIYLAIITAKYDKT